jgi:Protein of unknown function (DUF2934)
MKMAAESASLQKTFLKSAKRTDPDSSQTASHRSESSRPNTLVSVTVGLIPASLRHDMISDAAYFRAEARGWVPGHEIEDWLAAELEIDELIRARYRY